VGRGQLRQQLRWSQQGAEGHEHRTDPHDGQPDSRPFDAIRRQQADSIAFDHTVGHESGRQGGAHVVDLGVRHGFVECDQGPQIAVLRAPASKKARDRLGLRLH